MHQLRQRSFNKLVACTALFFSVAAAAQVPPRLTTLGAGSGSTCSDWTAFANVEPLLEQWAFGFMSAMAATVQSQLGLDPLASTNVSELRTWLLDYCRGNPEETLGGALVRVVFLAARAAR